MSTLLGFFYAKMLAIIVIVYLFCFSFFSYDIQLNLFKTSTLVGYSIPHTHTHTFKWIVRARDKRLDYFASQPYSLYVGFVSLTLCIYCASRFKMSVSLSILSTPSDLFSVFISLCFDPWELHCFYGFVWYLVSLFCDFILNESFNIFCFCSVLGWVRFILDWKSEVSSLVGVVRMCFLLCNCLFWGFALDLSPRHPFWELVGGWVIFYGILVRDARFSIDTFRWWYGCLLSPFCLIRDSAWLILAELVGSTLVGYLIPNAVYTHRIIYL